MSPITARDYSLVLTQVKHQKQNIDNLPALQNTSTATNFEAEISNSQVAITVIAIALYYTDNNLHPNGETGQLIIEDSLFVIKADNLDLLKDAHNKDVILSILSDKIKETTQKQVVVIKDDPDALRFLLIISNFRTRIL